MAKKIHKLSQGGKTVYPATISDAVVHPGTRTSINSLFNEINVSVVFPTSGTDGTNRYTLEGAVAQVPAELRNVGLKVSFVDSAGQVETWEYQGGTFTNTGSWKQQSSGGNKILEWNTDAVTTRKQIPKADRKAGMQVSYKNAEGKWVNELYTGTAIDDVNFPQDKNWQIIVLDEDINITNNPAFNKWFYQNRFKIHGDIQINDKIELRIFVQDSDTGLMYLYVRKNDDTLFDTPSIRRQDIVTGQKMSIHSAKYNLDIDFVFKEKFAPGESLDSSFCKVNLDVVLSNDEEAFREDIESLKQEVEAIRPTSSTKTFIDYIKEIPASLRKFGYKLDVSLVNKPKEYRVNLFTRNIANATFTVRTRLGDIVITSSHTVGVATPFSKAAQAIYEDIVSKLPDDWSLKPYNKEPYFTFIYSGNDGFPEFRCEETSGNDFEIIFKLAYTDGKYPRLKERYDFSVGPNEIVYVSLKYNKDMTIEDIERDLLNFTKTKSQYAKLFLPKVEKMDDEPHKYRVVIPSESSVIAHGSKTPEAPASETGITTTIISCTEMSPKYLIADTVHASSENEHVHKQFASTDLSKFEDINYWNDYDDNTDYLNQYSLWDRMSDTIELDISDGRPVYFSLPLNMNYSEPYTFSLSNMDGTVIQDVKKNMYGSNYIQSAVSDLLNWSNRHILVSDDGWSVFKGFSYGMSKMTVNINPVLKEWLVNKLFILKEDDFHRLVGVKDKYKVSIGTRNLGTFAGGYNTLVDELFKADPFQNVVFLSTIYNQGYLHSFAKILSNFDNVNRTIKALAEYWNVPYIDMTRQALFTHKNKDNLLERMADRLHPAASNPEVKVYVSIDGALNSGNIIFGKSDWNAESTVPVTDNDTVDSLLEKINAGLAVKANVSKRINSDYSYMAMSLVYNAQSTSQKTSIPTVNAGDTGVIIKVVQKEDQVKKYANYLSAQLTAMFGDLKDKHVLWIGTSIPAGNTYSFAVGQKYPELIQGITKCRMTNKSKAGSYLRKYGFYNHKNQEGLEPPQISWNTTKAEGNDTGFSIDDIKEIVNSSDSPYLVVIDMGINDYMSDQGVEFVVYDFDHPFNED